MTVSPNQIIIIIIIIIIEQPYNDDLIHEKYMQYLGAMPVFFLF